LRLVLDDILVGDNVRDVDQGTSRTSRR